MKEPKPLPRPCGNDDCLISAVDYGRTNLPMTLTFGSGSRDAKGYWEHPCTVCSKAYKKDHPNQKVWPSNHLQGSC